MKEELLGKETHATAEECTRQKDLLVPFLMTIISLSICWERSYVRFLGVLAAKVVQKKSGLLIGDGMRCLFTRAFTRK